jgi:hypothetical protein
MGGWDGGMCDDDGCKLECRILAMQITGDALLLCCSPPQAFFPFNFNLNL